MLRTQLSVLRARGNDGLDSLGLNYPPIFFTSRAATLGRARDDATGCLPIAKVPFWDSVPLDSSLGLHQPIEVARCGLAPMCALRRIGRAKMTPITVIP